MQAGESKQVPGFIFFLQAAGSFDNNDRFTGKFTEKKDES